MMLTKLAKLTALLMGALGVVHGYNLAVGAVPMASEVSYYAQIDKNGVVQQVIVAQPWFINEGHAGDPKNWIQTSASGTIRKNFASKGYMYDKNRDAFINSKASSTMIFNEEKAQWEYPAAQPRAISATST